MADRVTVIGWDGSPLTAAARSALSAATLVAGAAHHLALPEVPATAERIRLGSIDLAARRIAGHRGSAVVLADGDPGFFGVVRTLRAPEHGLEVEVVPAVSAVAAAFARAGMPWDDAQIVVAHPRTLRRAVNVCRAHTKVAVLTSPGAGPAELALLLEGVHRTFVICEELGTDTRTGHRPHLRQGRRPRLARPERRDRHRWRRPEPQSTGWPGSPAATPRAYRRLGARWAPAPAARRTRKGSRARASRPGCAPPNSPASARVPATSSGTSAPAAELSPWRPPASARRCSPSTATRTPAPARRPRPGPVGVQLQVVQGRAPHVLERLPEPDVVRIGGGGVPVVTACRRPQAGTDRHPCVDPGRGRGARRGTRRERLHRRVRAAPVRRTRHRPHWSERERSVVFLLSALRSDLAP